MSQDSISRFLIDDSNVRGEVVQLTESWQEILRRAEYPQKVRELLGEAVAATALLAETIKFDGSLTLQVRGSGPVELLVVQVTSENTLRGMAKCADDSNIDSLPGSTLNELVGDGQMLITIEMGEGKQDYQGIVPLEGDRLQEAIGAYFENSEQLPTHVWLATSETNVAGLLVQKLPGEEVDGDLWSRVNQFASTVKPEELLGLDADQLLYRLFNEEEVRLFDPERLSFKCTCSRERTANAIKSLGLEEAREIVREEGCISVQCQFCKADYQFSDQDVSSLFGEAARGPIH